jgi:anaerobic selenocysteine-containing dehydrogenase
LDDQRLARATLDSRHTSIAWEHLADDYDRIRELIARVVPGCEDYNERIRHPAGFVLHNAARERVFRTPNGKARFTVQELPPESLAPGQLLMMTVRSHDQYNTTVYGLADRYRGVRGRRVVFMNPDDARERGLHEGDVVDITSHFVDGERKARRFVVKLYAIPRRCCATYFPEGNVLVPLGAVARKSHTPASKSVVVTVAKSAPE